MGNLVLDNNLLTTISSLAERLKLSKEEIVKKAVNSYEKKVNQENSLMSYAGILDEKEADDILNCIYSSRQNKELELPG